MNVRARSGGSAMRMPTTTSPSAACWASFALNSGNSDRQGTQVGPQKFTMTGRPRRAARSNATPSSVVPTISGAGWPLAIVGLSAVGRVRLTAPRTAPVAANARTSANRIGRRRLSRRTSAADGQNAKHQGRVDRALELVGPGCQGGNVVGLLPGSGEVLAVEDLLAARVEDVEVVRDAGVLVVERDLERLVRGRAE